MPTINQLCVSFGLQILLTVFQPMCPALHSEEHPVIMSELAYFVFTVVQRGYIEDICAWAGMYGRDDGGALWKVN